MNVDVQNAIKSSIPPMLVSEYLLLLQKVKRQIQERLEERKKGIDDKEGTLEQLEYILNELNLLESEINSGDLSKLKGKRLVSAQIVTDSWPLESELVEKINQLDIQLVSGITQ